MNDNTNPLPPLSQEEYAALKADIASRGILVPILVDDHGNTIDGFHRRKIAEELGIDCPTQTVSTFGPEDRRHTAITLNLARRHLSQAQKRQLIAEEITRDPDASNRAIGRLLACDHKTVAAVRRTLGGESPHLERIRQIFAERDHILDECRELHKRMTSASSYEDAVAEGRLLVREMRAIGWAEIEYSHVMSQLAEREGISDPQVEKDLPEVGERYRAYCVLWETFGHLPLSQRPDWLSMDMDEEMWEESEGQPEKAAAYAERYLPQNLGLSMDD